LKKKQNAKIQALYNKLINTSTGFDLSDSAEKHLFLIKALRRVPMDTLEWGKP
jgi:hypothetical protein